MSTATPEPATPLLPTDGTISALGKSSLITGGQGNDQRKKTSTNTNTGTQDSFSSSASSKQDNSSAIGQTTFSPVDTILSPGAQTPMVMSPDASVIAMHGSVLPQAQGRIQRRDHDRERGRTGTNTSTRTPDWDDTAVRLHAQAHALGRDNPLSLNIPDAKEQVEETVIAPPASVEAKDKAKTQKLNTRIIAIDFDDVCTQGMLAMLNEHNDHFGTDLTLDDLETYVFWQCRGWGTPADTARKMRIMRSLLDKTEPVPGFADSIRAIHLLGHPIHIVTSRAETDREAVTEWLAKYGITIGKGEIDEIEAAWFTHTYSKSFYPTLGEKGDTDSAIAREDDLNERLIQVWAEGVSQGAGGKGKLKVLREINASLFIDDHHGNLDPIISADPPIECLLFGTYGWNKGKSGMSSPVEMMDYDKRVALGLQLPFEEIEFGKEKGLYRVKDWDEVVSWVKGWDESEDEA